MPYPEFNQNQGNPGIVKEFSIIFVQVREKLRKSNYFVHISFSLTLCMAARKVAVPFVVSKCKCYHLHSTIASIYPLPIC